MRPKTATITRTALFAAVMAVSAYIRIPTGVVPITLQSAAVLIAGYCLGPVHGAAAALLYTAVGLAGLPVFAYGGGPAYVLSPTFGYILGFTVCACLTGFLARFNRRNSVTFAYLIMAASLSGIYIPGVFWLMAALQWIADVPSSTANILRAGLFIPLAGDLITTIPAAFIAVRLRKLLHT